MKNLILMIGLVFAVQASAEDKLVTEVTCLQVVEPGSADSAVTILIQSNSTAWAKRISVLENGFLGRREIGTFTMPGEPKLKTVNMQEFLVYEAKGLSLSMAVRSTRTGYFATGPAEGTIEIPEYPILTGSFKCKTELPSPRHRAASAWSAYRETRDWALEEAAKSFGSCQVVSVDEYRGRGRSRFPADIQPWSVKLACNGRDIVFEVLLKESESGELSRHSIQMISAPERFGQNGPVNCSQIISGF